MADISDVEQAIVEAITTVLYPAGSSQASIVGTLCRIYRGWPNSATLNADLKAGLVNVTITADNDTGRNTTRYLPEWTTISAHPGVSTSVVGVSLTILGNPAPGDVVGALIDGIPFVYRIQAGDTPDLVAANLGQSILGTRIANLRGATITIPGARSVISRVVCDNAASFESRRQEKDLRIGCWCPTPLMRDAVAFAIDAATAQLGFLPLPDAAQARIIYRNTASHDQSQNALLYRRDLIYTVEYPTITTIQQPTMVFGASDLNTNITYG